MADNDIELSVGVKFDEASFANQFPSFVSKTSADMQKHINDIVDNTSGTAAKQWGTLPYLSMHDASKGAVNATKAFLPSLAQDLQNAGYSPDSPEYKGALVNAAYRSTMADPMQRYHRMLAGGLTQWADLTHPDTAVGQTIETDYQLMSQPWSRDFIRQTKGEELDADKLSKLKVRELRKMADDFGLKGLSHANKADIISALVEKSKEPRLGFDFAGMREYAVEAGLGKWKDEDGEHTADNFELINDELEKIEDKSKKTKKNFLDWHDVLKGTLGTLTAIAAIGIKAFEVAYKSSEKNTVEAGGHVDSRRAFIGMSALDELKTKVASKAVGLGEDSIKNEIYSMSDFRERYKLMGEGDALPSALLNIFDNMVSSDDPYSAYTKSADEIYEQLKGADDSTRRRWLMLMNKAGLGSMSSLVGQFLSNPEYAEQYKTPSALFDLKQNPFYGVYGKAETMLPDIAKLNESLAASYKTMYTAWEEAFGVPFKTWWDDTMKDKVVPWFLTILGYTKDKFSEEGRKSDSFDKQWENTLKLQQKANSSKKLLELELTDDTYGYAAQKAIAYKGAHWETLALQDFTKKYIQEGKDKRTVNRLEKDYTTEARGDSMGTPEEFLAGLEALANEGNYKKGTLTVGDKHYSAEADKMQSRAEYILSWLDATGFKSDLSTGSNNLMTSAVIKVLKEALNAGSVDEFQGTLDTFLNTTYLRTPGWQNVIEPFLRQNASYLKANPDKLTEIKITLFDMYGKEIQARVDEIVTGADDSTVNR